MKRSELKVGEEYAYRENSWRPARRVKIVARNVPRGGRGLASTIADAIEIEYVTGVTGRDGSPVRAAGTRVPVWSEQIGRRFVAPWATFAADEERRQAERVAANHRDGERTANANAICVALGLPVSRYSYHITIGPELHALIAGKLGVTLPHAERAAEERRTPDAN